jgi:5'-nucleotidase
VRLRILVTNDDGIYAQGMWALAESLQEVGEVVIVAPDREQSATGTAITLHQPLRFREVRSRISGIKAYSVEGTPADSVLLALRMLMKGGADLVFSGINEGANLGDDVLLSGTVGGALQGYFRGLPAVALSVEIGERMHFEAAARVGALLASKLSASGSNRGTLLNINLPNLPPEEIEGVEITRLARRGYLDQIKEGYDGKRRYYWIVRGEPRWEAEEGTDIWAITGRKISITPLHSDLTDVSQCSLLQSLVPPLFADLTSFSK